MADETVRLKPECAVGVVIAAGGYPERVEKGLKLPDLRKLPKDLMLFHASTAMEQGHLVNQGGRTLTVVAQAGTVEEARAKVYAGLARQSWGSYFYREDIGLTGNSGQAHFFDDRSHSKKCACPEFPLNTGSNR